MISFLPDAVSPFFCFATFAVVVPFSRFLFAMIEVSVE